MDIAKQRNIGLDILRVLLALMVIAIHFNAPATGQVHKYVSGEMRYLVYPIISLCYPAVNVYVLISGYFGYFKKKPFMNVLASLFRLWICLLFFSFLGYLLALSFYKESFSILVLVKHLFPLSRGVWWFMTVYFVMMLLSPILNIVIDKQSKKEYITMMLLALLICSIIPFFLKFESIIGLNMGYGLIWFIVLYLTGGGIAKYYLNEKEKNNKSVWNAMFGYLAFTFYLLVSHSLYKIVGMGDYTSSMYNSVIVYGQSVSLFIMFWNIDIKNYKFSRLISFMAGLSMAAYIFHCQEDVERMLWQLTEPYKYANTLHLVPLFFYTIFGVYFLSVVIEYLRKVLFSIGNFEDIILASFLQKTYVFYESFYDYLEKKKLI